MSSLLTAAVRSVAGKMTRPGLETRTSRPPASTTVISELAMPGVLRHGHRQRCAANAGAPHLAHALHLVDATMSGPQGPVDPAFAAPRPIDPHLRVGHVHLRTADTDRIRAFYVDVMGFDVVFEARDVP